MDRREQIQQRFNRAFAHWEIKLPDEAMPLGVVWIIVEQGWTIWTRFDVEDGCEHLDYYAMHRMTSDSHVRLYANGKKGSLPVIGSCYGWLADATEAEN